jgi:hypothetical protein
MHMLAPSHLKFPRPRLGKALSVMAWIEDGYDEGSMAT